MIRLLKDQRVELLDNYQGGNGTLEIRHVIEPENHNNPYLNMVATVTLNPGVTVGDHTHEGLTEVIFILKGRALYNDGSERILEPGDAAVVFESDHQSIRSADDKPMTYLACIAVK